MATMVYDSDLRTLNESELVYKISNRKNVDFHEESTFEDFLQQLTPGRKETALAVIELYTRMKVKKDNASRILSSVAFPRAFEANKGLQLSHWLFVSRVIL